MFGRRQKKPLTAPIGRDGEEDEEAAAKEDAAAVAAEIESAMRADPGGTGKEKIGNQTQENIQKFLIGVSVAIIILYGPNPFWSDSPPTLHEIKAEQHSQLNARVDKMVADCTKRLQVCQAQLMACRGKGNCSPSVMAACDKLIHLCTTVNGRSGVPQGQALSPQQLQPQPMAMQQQPVVMQQPEQELGTLPQLQLQPDPRQALEPAFQESDDEAHEAELEPLHQEQPLHHEFAQHKEEEPVELELQPQAAMQPEVGITSAHQEEAMTGTCQEAGELQGGVCICPALHAGPACPGGAAPAPGTCACEGGQTTPFVHKDHVSKLVKRELPQAFTGPAVLDRQNPAINSGIKVHLPGKEPAWKKIGKVSAKEAKMLPAKDPVGGHIYKSCAIVGNSGVMLLEAKGEEIDAHELVMRFNGAPTAGLERFLGSKTTVRIVNHSWQDFRETADEIVLSHLRGPHHLEDFKLRRKANGDSEKWFLFSPEFSNYAAQTAYEVATYFDIDLQAEGEQAWTPTGGWTGIVMALNLCAKVDIYGFHISERHGVPYHYHNRCPQPFAHRDSAEWKMIQVFHKHGLVDFRNPCVVECHDSDEACQECKGKNPVPRTVYEAGKAMWQKGPMPEYCSARLDWLKKEEKSGRCQGLCGKFEKKTDWGKPVAEA